MVGGESASVVMMHHHLLDISRVTPVTFEAWKVEITCWPMSTLAFFQTKKDW
jgi:hypothetical protein